MNSRWIYLLVNSKDLSPIGELTQARGKNITLTLNRPGNASFSLSMTDDLAASITPLSTGLLVYRVGSDEVVRAIWSGYVATIDEDVLNNSMTVNCIGWLERLTKRLTREKLIYTSLDDKTIIYNLLAHANLTTNDGYTVPIPTGSSPNNPTWIQEGISQPNDGPGGSVPYVPLTDVSMGPAPRNKTYEKWTPIGPEILALTDIENGCDIHIRPESRHLDIYRRRSEVQSDVIFGYNWGPNNLSTLQRQLDSSVVVNYHLTTGRPTTTPQYADDTDSQDSYGLIEELASLSDVGENTILQAYAGGEVFLRAQPRVIYSLQPFPYIEGGRVPEPFVDYELGDKVYLTAIWGDRINISGQGVRLFGFSFNIDEEGNERPGPLQVYPGG